MSFIETNYPVNELDQVTGNICAQHMGKTLLDSFAESAMKAIISMPDKDEKIRGAKGVHTIARYSYEYANAMMEERQRWFK